jgi:hypothetical protein
VLPCPPAHTHRQLSATSPVRQYELVRAAKTPISQELSKVHLVAMLVVVVDSELVFDIYTLEYLLSLPLINRPDSKLYIALVVREAAQSIL